MAFYTLRDGTTMAYDDIGVGRPVVFLHGWSCTKQDSWAPIIAEVGKKYRAIAVDFRGSGQTAPSRIRPVTTSVLIADLHDFLAGNNLRDCTLVGSSMGGNVSMGYVDRYGCDEYLRAFINVDMTPRTMTDPDDPSWTLGQYKGKYTPEMVREDTEVVTKDLVSWWRSFALKSRPEMAKLPKEELEAFYASRMNFNPQECAELYASFEHIDWRHTIPKFTIPFGYFYADPGSLYSPALAEYYRKTVSGPYKAVGFPSKSHSFYREMPHEFSEEVIKFMDEF